MPNILWYYSFIGVGLALIGYTMYKKKMVIDLLAFFVGAVTVVFIGELIVLFIFEGYQYKPEVFADPFANNVVGHIIPNMALWATTAVVVGAFRLRFRWIVLIAAGYMLIEVFFLRLNLYEHHWWKTYMTGIAIVIYLSMLKYGYQKLMSKHHPLLRHFTIILLGVVVLHTPSIIFLLLDMEFYHIGWVSNVYRESILFGVIYHSVVSLIIVLSLRVLKNGYKLILPLLIFYLLDTILLGLNILRLSKGLRLEWVLLTSTVSFAAVVWFDHYSLREARYPAR